jgi:hypothetical protein
MRSAFFSGTLLVLLGFAAPVCAKTIGQIMNSSCASAATAARYEEQAKDSYRLGDPISVYGPIYRKAARLNYYCAKQASGSEAHDWFLYFYASDLYSSNYDRSTELIARHEFNELAANSRFRNVRRAALKARNSIHEPSQ